MNDRLEDLVKHLPRHLEPERDMWPEIAARLRPRRRRMPGLAFYRIAAVLAIVAVALGAYFAFRTGTPEPASTRRIAQFQPDPETAITHSLAAVNENIAKITTALERDPDNQLLYRFLSEAYLYRSRLMLERIKLSIARSEIS